MSERSVGCLTMLLRLIGIDLAALAEKRAAGALPYRLRDDFLSPAELSFYHVLRQSVGGDYVVLAKVNLADLLFVPGKQGVAFRNKIDRKHVDFVLCDPASMKPHCAIELDDRSHQRADRQERDAFIDAALKTAGLCLVRIAASRSYSPKELRKLIALPEHPQHSEVAAPLREATSSPPSCPKCGVAMVERKATRGDNLGQRFWGCANYPKCRSVLPITSLR